MAATECRCPNIREMRPGWHMSGCVNGDGRREMQGGLGPEGDGFRYIERAKQ